MLTLGSGLLTDQLGLVGPTLPSPRLTRRRGPASAFTDADRAAFQDDGYLAVPGPVVTTADLAELAELLDRQFARFHDLPEEIAMDLGGPRAPRGGLVRVPDLDYVTSLDHRFRRTRAVRVFRALAEDLYGGPLQLTFDHAIYKPAGRSGDVPWHQDSGFDDSGRDTLTVWIPLQDTDSSNGCLRYVPGSHHAGPKTHVDLEGRHGKVLLEPVDVTTSVDVPVPAGGVLIHRRDVIHGSGPNNADVPRRTFILNLTPPIGVPASAKLAMSRAHVKRLSVQAHVAARLRARH